MFVAFAWLETFSKFPALCMARVGFVSPWLGSKHRALALLPRRREEWFRLQGERERRRAGHRHTPSPRRGRGRGGAGGPDRALCRPPAELRLGLGLPAPPYRTSLRGTSRSPAVVLAGASSSAVSPERPVSALRVLWCLLVCGRSHGLHCS